MSKRLASLSLLVIAVAIGLTACGAGGDETATVEEVIETAATSKDPVDCKKLQTQGFMEQTSHQSGSAAVSQCEEEAKQGAGAEKVAVSNVAIDGSDATAEVKLQGGNLTGQTIEVALVDDGDQWKMDKVVKFTKYDQASLIDFFSKEFKKSSSGISPKLASCLLGVFEKSSQAEVEDLFISGSSKALEEAAESCESGSAG